MTTGPGRWSGVELRHLLALSAIAQTGSFHGAAEQLGYTQSTVSEQIATLERIVGRSLIDRPGGPRQVSLTEAGRLLLGHAEAIMARLRAAEADMRALSVGEVGSIAIGTYQSVSRRILPPLMQRFSSTWTGVSVSLTESANDSDFFPLIERGDLDLAFATYPLLPGPFEAVELLSDPYVLVVRDDSPLADLQRAVTLKDISPLQLIGFRQRRSVAPIEMHLRSRGIEPSIAFRSDDYPTVEALVASGMGSALVPRLTVTHTDRRVMVLPLDDDLPARRIVLFWHRDRAPSAPMRAFVAEAQSICGALG